MTRIRESSSSMTAHPRAPQAKKPLHDRQALESRKRNKPSDSAIDMAEKMGIEILTEAQYRELQSFGSFDTKTSAWVKTPEGIRKLGALFCDRRCGTVFVYHGGAIHTTVSETSGVH